MDEYGNPVKRLMDMWVDRQLVNGGELVAGFMCPHGTSKLIHQPTGLALPLAD
jgi:hypothetical protein